MEQIVQFELLMARISYRINLPDYKKLELIRTITFCESYLENNKLITQESKSEQD